MRGADFEFMAWLARAVYDSQLASGPAYESTVGLRKVLAERQHE